MLVIEEVKLRLEGIGRDSGEIRSLGKKPPSNESDRTLNVRLLVRCSLVAKIGVDTECAVIDILDPVVEREVIDTDGADNVLHRWHDDACGLVRYQGTGE